MNKKMKWQQLLQDNASLPRQYYCAVTDQEATIWLYDVIGEDAWGGISAARFVKDLQHITAPLIHLRINSPGGDVFDARAMVTAIKQHPAHIIVHIDGLAASAASYIALAGDEVEMSDGAFFMIHNAWGLVVGNRHDLLDMAATLEKIDASIVADYHKKTGLSLSQLEQWMDAETWFTAQEALEAGFIDRIAAEKEHKPAALHSWNLSAYAHPPNRLSQNPPPHILAEQSRLRRVHAIEQTA